MMPEQVCEYDDDSYYKYDRRHNNNDRHRVMMSDVFQSDVIDIEPRAHNQSENQVAHARAITALGSRGTRQTA